jgi:hypothetical protein
MIKSVEVMAISREQSEAATMSKSSASVERPLHRQRPCPRQCRGNNLLSVAWISMWLSMMVMKVNAWGSSGNSEADESVYGNAFVRDWLYDSKSLSFKVDGCVWGFVEDSEEVGCLEDESEDGTTNWYMMANCRRPQVAFSVYASSSSSTSCNSNNFVGSVSLKERQSRAILPFHDQCWG